MEPPSQRGQILATGQRLRFTFSMIAGLIQTFLLNGKSTSPSDCKIGISGCWSFGLTMQGYYGLLFCFTLALVLPIFYMREIKANSKVGVRKRSRGSGLVCAYCLAAYRSP
jgi:hypothetical protein